jgi:2-polyprenyl-6-methoxyphenol hydroxylase-like FAD-dependent oxidoreductase
MNTTTDVLIVGAGPVGLQPATELSRDGVDVLLIDRLSERSFFCKALGVTPYAGNLRRSRHRPGCVAIS